MVDYFEEYFLKHKFICISQKKKKNNQFNVNTNFLLLNMLYIKVTEANKDCKDMYTILLSRKKEAIKAVHKRNGEEFVNRSVLTFMKCWSKLQKNHWLKFTILHRIIATNYYLSKLKLKDTQLCTFY